MELFFEAWKIYDEKLPLKKIQKTSEKISIFVISTANY